MLRNPLTTCENTKNIADSQKKALILQENIIFKTMAERNVRVRFAPSPTGPLHIGGVRTALYNYLFARQHGGKLIFRIEDTDSNRFVPGAEEYILDSFDWLGIKFDEGVSFGGEHGPYRQSERRDIYKKYVNQLLEAGKAYIAFDTPEELDAKRKEIENFQYDAHTRLQMRNSLTMSKEEVESLIEDGQQYVVRFKIEPGEEVHVNDIIRGDVCIKSDILDDKVLFKSADELPTYHLANIVDDHLMEISHVIRGEEWLPSAPLHVLLYRAFGWEDSMPRFAHLPLLLKPEGKGKLSKRDGDRLGFPVFPLEWHDPKTGEVSSGYRESGYFPEAVVNFLALLGWNPGTEQELFSLEELVEAFDITKCSKSGAKFDYQKGMWFNHEYILQKSDDEIAQLFAPIVANNGIEATMEQVTQVVHMMKDRVSFVKELWELCSFFFIAPTSYDEKTVKKRWKEYSAQQMSELADVLEGIEDFSVEGQEPIVLKWVENKGYKLGDIMNAFRLTLVGIGKGPGMFDISAFLGKEETLKRMHKAIEVLG
ncbi:glutamate--tRNA ligase [Prevotella melaninogenica ATCC 25845]|nr:glutamate--tRNA ligase [Prevotella melaninogenica ATCC 25845]